MEIVNTTPVPARVTVHAVADARVAVITAKATFRIAARPWLDVDHAQPLLDADEASDDGVVPGDAIGRLDQPFEVFSIGRAHAPTPVRAMTVSLQVGAVARDMLVVGDRQIEHGLGGPTIGRPAPFTTMPLGWVRAFGGRPTVLLDNDTPFAMSHPLNPLGRGFDPTTDAALLGQRLRVPAGFPAVPRERHLPNVEDPRTPIRGLRDAPEPYGWSAIPREIGLCLAARDRLAARSDVRDPFAYRAHPDWVIDTPLLHAPVIAEGLRPGGATRFGLPAIRLLADHAAGNLELRPQQLCLHWSRDVFTVTFRGALAFGAASPARLRLRLLEGWWADARTGAAG